MNSLMIKKFIYLLSCKEFDETIDTTLIGIVYLLTFVDEILQKKIFLSLYSLKSV